MRLERSELADADLDDILVYSLTRFGEAIAHDYYFGFETAFALLERFPNAGQAMDHFGASVRRLTHRRHHIYYEVQADRILVLRVLHHAMKAEGRIGG